MSKRKEIIGKRFGRLIVKEYVSISKWLCECDCGEKTIVYGSNLVNGHTKSCGCLKGARHDRTQDRSAYSCAKA